MSNKTIISDISPNKPKEVDAGGFYGRSANLDNHSRTYIPDTYRNKGQAKDKVDSQANQQVIKLQDRVIVGLLFSISHTSFGEIFPIYIGRNTIGSDTTSDVYLNEETVSPNHAVILVRNIQEQNGTRETLTVSITDYDSEFGTKVGDTILEYDKIICQNNDIISIGERYKLLLCLFDTKSMFVDPKFKQLRQQNVEPAPIVPPQHIEIRHEQMPQDFAQGVDEQSEFDFYMPTKKREEDHSVNTTFIQ